MVYIVGIFIYYFQRLNSDIPGCELPTKSGCDDICQKYRNMFNGLCTGLISARSAFRVNKLLIMARLSTGIITAFGKLSRFKSTIVLGVAKI